MTPNEIKAAIDAAIGAKIMLTYPQLILFVLLSGVAAFFGAYLKKKGEHLATAEDLQILTKKVEEIKATYSKQIEDYKAEIDRRARAAKVAEFFTEWSAPNADLVKLNGFSMELSLWLPNKLYRKLASCVCYRPDAPFPKEVLIDIRKYLLDDDLDDLKPDEIVHFSQQPKISAEPNTALEPSAQ